MHHKIILVSLGPVLLHQNFKGSSRILQFSQAFKNFELLRYKKKTKNFESFLAPARTKLGFFYLKN
jgi:hypothetical protein